MLKRRKRAHDATRARFLRGDIRARRLPLRPPWSLPETSFVNLCNRCGECAKRCPEGILVAGEGGFPAVDFTRGDCTFCGDCVAACETGALGAPADEPWDLRAAIDSGRCIAFRGVVCRACGEHCEARAIRFRLAVGGRALPELDPGACSGCGACVRPCPVQAIEVTHGKRGRLEEELKS